VKKIIVRRLTRGSVLSFAGIVLVTACSGNLMSAPSQTAEVQITVERDAYHAGDTVKVDVKNVSGVPLTFPYAFCRTVLQQQGGAAWVTVSAPSGGCPLALGLLSEGAVVTHIYALPANLPTGRYRLLMPSPEPKDAQTQDTVATPAFTVNSVTL